MYSIVFATIEARLVDHGRRKIQDWAQSMHHVRQGKNIVVLIEFLNQLRTKLTPLLGKSPL